VFSSVGVPLTILVVVIVVLPFSHCSWLFLRTLGVLLRSLNGNSLLLNEKRAMHI
jgi:hypothetical protein